MFYDVRGVGFPDDVPPYLGPDPFTNRPESLVLLATMISRIWASFISEGNPNFAQGECGSSIRELYESRVGCEANSTV